jgi:hypothetical protein
MNWGNGNRGGKSYLHARAVVDLEFAWVDGGSELGVKLTSVTFLLGIPPARREINVSNRYRYITVETHLGLSMCSYIY